MLVSAVLRDGRPTRWMQPLSFISPATYVIRGMRDAPHQGADLAAVWPKPVAGTPGRAISILSACARSVGRATREAHRRLKRSGMKDTVKRTNVSFGLRARAMRRSPRMRPNRGAAAESARPEGVRYWWRSPTRTGCHARFVVARGEQRIGYAAAEHPRWDVQPERYGTVDGNLVPAERTRAALDTLYASMEQRVIADGAKILSAWTNEDDPVRIETLVGRGYREDRHSRRWELDLVANREKLLAMTEESRTRMTKEGVRMLTLDDGRRPERDREDLEALGGGRRRRPDAEPRVPEEMASLHALGQRAGDPRDRFWIARTAMTSSGFRSSAIHFRGRGRHRMDRDPRAPCAGVASRGRQVRDDRAGHRARCG